MQRHVDVDEYIRRSERWPDLIAELRPILLGRGLDETIKWGKPCYSLDGRNIVILQEMKDFLAVMFFKGAVLDDPAGVLHEQGPNSQAARRMQFRSVDEVRELADVVEEYVDRAIEAEVRGLEIEPAPEPTLADELQRRLDTEPALKAAFDGLTPGRRREYHLYVAGAKQATTRESRIDRCVPRILAGKGLRDR